MENFKHIEKYREYHKEANVPTFKNDHYMDTLPFSVLL